MWLGSVGMGQVVGESGLFVPDDVALVHEAGCGAVRGCTAHWMEGGGGGEMFGFGSIFFFTILFVFALFLLTRGFTIFLFSLVFVFVLDFAFWY